MLLNFLPDVFQSNTRASYCWEHPMLIDTSCALLPASSSAPAMAAGFNQFPTGVNQQCLTSAHARCSSFSDTVVWVTCLREPLIMCSSTCDQIDMPFVPWASQKDGIVSSCSDQHKVSSLYSLSLVLCSIFLLLYFCFLRSYSWKTTHMSQMLL